MPIDVANDDIQGTLIPGGVETGWLNTTISVGTSATLLPSTPLTGRKAVMIHNTDPSATLYIGPTNAVTADQSIGNTAGAEIGPGERFNFDVATTINIYGIVSTGTIIVKITELA